MSQDYNPCMLRIYSIKHSPPSYFDLLVSTISTGTTGMESHHSLRRRFPSLLCMLLASFEVIKKQYDMWVIRMNLKGMTPNTTALQLIRIITLSVCCIKKFMMLVRGILVFGKLNLHFLDLFLLVFESDATMLIPYLWSF